MITHPFYYWILYNVVLNTMLCRMNIILHVNRICKRLFFIHNIYYLKVAKKIDCRYNTKDRTLVRKAGKSEGSCLFL